MGGWYEQYYRPGHPPGWLGRLWDRVARSPIPMSPVTKRMIIAGGIPAAAAAAPLVFAGPERIKAWMKTKLTEPFYSQDGKPSWMSENVVAALEEAKPQAKTFEEAADLMNRAMQLTREKTQRPMEVTKGTAEDTATLMHTLGKYTPGMSAGALAGALGVSAPAILRHLKGERRKRRGEAPIESWIEKHPVLATSLGAGGGAALGGLLQAALSKSSAEGGSVMADTKEAKDALEKLATDEQASDARADAFVAGVQAFCKEAGVDPSNLDAVLSDEIIVDAVKEAVVTDPAGLAAAIGRKKYGKKKFQGMAAAGKKASEDPPAEQAKEAAKSTPLSDKAKFSGGEPASSAPVGEGGRFAALKKKLAAK